jgi:hypothetical protein
VFVGNPFARIAVLESTLTQFAPFAMLANGLHRVVPPRCAAQIARRLKGLRRPVEAKGADPRAHASERDEKEARHSSFNYKFH